MYVHSEDWCIWSFVQASLSLHCLTLLFVLTHIVLERKPINIGVVTRKPVFGVSDKTGCSATVTSYNIEILLVSSLA